MKRELTMNAADMRETLSVVGYYLDVVSLAKASMVCRIWKAAFENHPKWKEFYLNSDEYLQGPLDKKGKWRELYGELFNRCKSLMCNAWSIEHYSPHMWFEECNSFYVDDKLIILANCVFYRVENYNLSHIPPIAAFLQAQLDRDYLYASTINGKLLKWKRNCFPSEHTWVIERGADITDFKIQNEVLYTLNIFSDLDTVQLITASRNSEDLWCLDFPGESIIDIKVNKYIGMILEKKDFVDSLLDNNGTKLFEVIRSGELMDNTSELYIWDSRSCEKPIEVGKCSHAVLMNDEVIYAFEDIIKARSLKGSREVCRNLGKIDAIIPNPDQNLIYIIYEEKIISTVCCSSCQIISTIVIEDNTLNFQEMKFFNGILYCVDRNGSLLLISPKGGIKRKGPQKMFTAKIEVHNGRVHGTCPETRKAVIVRPL